MNVINNCFMFLLAFSWPEILTNVKEISTKFKQFVLLSQYNNTHL